MDRWTDVNSFLPSNSRSVFVSARGSASFSASFPLLPFGSPLLLPPIAAAATGLHFVSLLAVASFSLVQNAVVLIGRELLLIL